MFLMTTPTADVRVINDIRAEEVSKMLTSIKAPKLNDLPNIVTVLGNNLYIITPDFSIVYYTTLKTPVTDNMMNISFFDNELEVGSGMLPFNDIAYFNSQSVLSKIDPGVVIASADNLQEDEKFKELLSKKSNEGMELYKIIGFNNISEKYYFIPVFSGFPKVNKSDTVSVNIHVSKNDSPNIFLVDMCVYKKNINRDIHTYYKILDIE